MINARVKIFFKSLGESVAALLVAIAMIACVMGGVWILFNAPAGIAIAIIVLGVIGGLTYYQYKEKLNELKYLDKRIEEVQQEIFDLENKYVSIVAADENPRFDNTDLQYWNNLLQDTRKEFDRLIQERKNLWRWNT